MKTSTGIFRQLWTWITGSASKTGGPTPPAISEPPLKLRTEVGEGESLGIRFTDGLNGVHVDDGDSLVVNFRDGKTQTTSLTFNRPEFISTALIDAMFDPHKSIGSLYGFPIPNNIQMVEMEYDHISMLNMVRWRTKTGGVHEYPYDPENPDVLFVTMRISC